MSIGRRNNKCLISQVIIKGTHVGYRPNFLLLLLDLSIDFLLFSNFSHNLVIRKTINQFLIFLDTRHKVRLSIIFRFFGLVSIFKDHVIRHDDITLDFLLHLLIFEKWNIAKVACKCWHTQSIGPIFPVCFLFDVSWKWLKALTVQDFSGHWLQFIHNR